jgi:hypothetical protein
MSLGTNLSRWFGLAQCKFNRNLDCSVVPKNGIDPCLICKRNRGHIALGVFC